MMISNMESCNIKELCTLLNGSEKLLIELRDRLQDWLKLQPHLPQNLSNELLEYFILGTKMSLEQAKHKLDMFYTIRRHVPEIFLERDPRGSRITNLHKYVEIAYLPKLTPEKYAVCVFRPFVKNYTNFDAYDSFKYVLMIEEILMTESRSLGSILVFDHAMVTFGFVAKYTPTVIKKSEVIFTEGFARRVKGIHIINAGPVTDTVVNLAKKILKPKLAARVHSHARGGFETFHQHVSHSVLPKDYGGSEPPLTYLAELWREKVEDKRDWFLEQEKIMIDERLRPGPAIDSDNLFGFSGSFRKLDVD